jgi:hypothetical protein
MSTQLEITVGSDDLESILEEDSNLHSADPVVNDYCFAVAQMQTDFNAKVFVETNETEVVVTMRIPRR